MLRSSTDGVYVGALSATARLTQVQARRLAPSELRQEMAVAAQDEIFQLKKKLDLWQQKAEQQQRACQHALMRWETAAAAAQEL